MEPGSEDLHPLVLAEGGIYLNRAARASPNRVALILQIDYHPAPRLEAISQTGGWAEHIHWKSKLIILGPRSSRCDRNIYWSMILGKTHCNCIIF